MALPRFTPTPLGGLAAPFNHAYGIFERSWMGSGHCFLPVTVRRGLSPGIGMCSGSTRRPSTYGNRRAWIGSGGIDLAEVQAENSADQGRSRRRTSRLLKMARELASCRNGKQTDFDRS